MKDRKHVTWLYDQLPTLVSEGVLPNESADRLRRHYGLLPAGGGKQWAILIFGILGAALIGAGVILLVAHNWDDLSRESRTALAFAPLVTAIALAGWVLTQRRGSAPWCEGAATYWALTIGAAISLVAQIYQIQGDPARFFLTWILLALPIIYLLRSGVTSCLYFVGATTWAGYATNTYARGTSLWYWGLLALVLPYLSQLWRAERNGWRAALTGWVLAICLAIGTAFSLDGAATGAWIGAYTGLLALMFLAGARWFGDTPTIWQRPWQTAGGLGLGIMALILTYKWSWNELHYQEWRLSWTTGPALIVGNTFSALLPITAICVAAFGAKRDGRIGLDRIIVGLAPLCGVIGYVLATTRNLTVLPQVIFNVYLLALGMSALVVGIRVNELERVNAGLVALSALIIARFFDGDLSFLARGVAFILVGTAFLITNVMMLRRKGASAT
jgi:uncharacterized membrane protein